MAELKKMSFIYKRKIHFYETDAMGVVHHSNYIRLFEEARVAMMCERGLMNLHYPNSDQVIAVLATECRHLKPAYFNDEVSVEAQGRMLGSRIQFQYLVRSERFAADPIANGMSLHIMVDSEMKVRKPPREMRELFAREIWTETWRSNLSE